MTWLASSGSAALAGGGERRCVTGLATGLIEQVFTGQHLGRVDIAAGGHGQVAGVEQHQAQNVIADFRLAVGAIAVGRLLRQATWASVQSSKGLRVVVRPISPEKA
jgi:hypothetical protein